MNQNLSKLTVLYVTHSLTSSPKDEWIDFLKGRCKKLIYIDHPFSYKKGDIRSSLTIFRDGQLVKQRYVVFPKKVRDILFYIKDVLLNTWWTLLAGRVDICISLDPLNTFSLLPFRKIGWIKKLIFYVIDYVPSRFSSNVENAVYHFIDRQCCYNVDNIWNLSARMQEGREKAGVNIKKCAPALVVPMGVDLSRVEPLPIEKINRQALVYMGAFLKKQGIQLVLKSMPALLEKLPDLKFIIIGVGEYEAEIKRLIKELNIEKNVDFRGYIKDHHEMEKMLCECAVGVAAYEVDEKSFSYYADPGKVKIYLGCGLPVVVTRFPLVAYEIEKKGAGFVIQYNQQELEKSLLDLFLDDNLYVEMRNNAIAMSKQYNWYDICKNALESSGYFVKE